MKETFYAFVPATALTIIFNTMSEWVESEFERKTEKGYDDGYNRGLEDAVKRLDKRTKVNGKSFAWIYREEAAAIRAMKEKPK